MNKLVAFLAIPILTVAVGVIGYQKLGIKENITGNNNSNVSSANISQESANFSFAVVGDTQNFAFNNPKGAFQLATQSIKKINPNFVIAIGDLISSCNESCKIKLEKWMGNFNGYEGKIYSIMGNHDRTRKDKSDVVWQDFFTLPTNGPEGYSEFTYSFDFSNSHFIFLNSEKPKEHQVNLKQRQWLEEDLRINKKENIFVFFHEPAFPAGSKIGSSLDVEKKERNALWKILDQHRVTAVFSGHEHFHSRRKINATIYPEAQNEIYQFITGRTDTFAHKPVNSGALEYYYSGKSFLLVEVFNKTITVKVYSVEGEILDSVSFFD